MDLQKFFQDGLGHDLFMAQRHFFVYRTIGEHADLINHADKSIEKSALNYMQGLAMEQVIMCLSKAYDKKSRNGKYKVRSLETILDQDFSGYGKFPYSLEYFNSFIKLQELIGIKFPSEEIKTSEEFIGFLKSVMEIPVVKAKIENLKLVRNKYIAHNEHLDAVPLIPEFWNEMVFLMDVAKLIVAVLGEVYFNSNYFQYESIGFSNVHYSILMELHWIISLIKTVIGDEDFKKWWDD
jgi:hypothetical protein